jgi:hypothetical protein
VVITCNAKVVLRTNHWTAVNVFCIGLSVIMWFPFLAILGNTWASFGMFSAVSGVHTMLMPEPRFW